VGFLAPWFLAGLAAVGLPLWLHLLKRHRSTPTPFPSIRFFERRTQSSIKHRRLHYLLLFAARTALVVVLVLAFANPFLRWQSGVGAGGRKLIVLAVDNSFSMRQGGRLERAKREAIAVAARARPDDRVQALAFASRVQQVDAIQAIAPDDGASSYAELARALRSLAPAAGLPLEVHLFSDMQKTSLPASFADVRLPDGAALILHPVASGPLPNYAVESVTAPARVFEAGARVQATVAGYGAPAATERVSLVFNGKVQASKTVDVPANGRATVEFPAIEPPFGGNRGEVRIDSGDAFPEDDRFLFSIERSEPRRALFIHDARDPRSALYVETALDASPATAVKLDSLSVEQAGGISPDKYAFVVLSDVAALPAGFESAVARYVREGGSLLITLGPATAARGRVPILNEAVVPARYEAAESSDRWEGVRFFQAARVESRTARVEARLSDSTPLLMEQRVGEGRVLVFASTFDNISNDFPLHASFVPFIQQTAQDLAGVARQSPTLVVGSHLELGTGRRGAAVEVLGPSGERALSLEESTRAQTLRLDRAGFYDVRRPSGRQELVAVNPDRRESDFSPVPEETLALWRNTGQPAVGSASQAEAREERRSLGWYFLAAALALAAAESVLANRYLSVNREAP
jgi:hypothetical protein